MKNCYQCRHPIHGNDDAGICIQCGGYNLRKDINIYGKLSDWLILLALVVVAVLAGIYL